MAHLARRADVEPGAAPRQRLDKTLSTYLRKGLSVVLNAVLLVAILGFFGVETTTFAALVAAGGVAVGVAWGGLLANFAAGAFLVFLRPFKVGDLVSAGGVTGVVDAIGLFGTTLHTPDNVVTIIGNNKVFSETIQNFSANPYRRVELSVTINHAVDHRVAIQLLKERLAAIPNVLDHSRPSGRDPPVHAGRTTDVRAAVLRQPALLAGLLRHESGHPRVVRRGGLPGAGPGLRADRAPDEPAAGHDGERIALASFTEAGVRIGIELYPAVSAAAWRGNPVDE